MAWKIPGKKRKKAVEAEAEPAEVFGADLGKTSREPQAEVAEDEGVRGHAKPRAKERAQYAGPEFLEEDGVERRPLREAGGASGSAATREERGREEGENQGEGGGRGVPTATSRNTVKQGAFVGSSARKGGAEGSKTAILDVERTDILVAEYTDLEGAENGGVNAATSEKGPKTGVSSFASPETGLPGGDRGGSSENLEKNAKTEVSRSTSAEKGSKTAGNPEANQLTTVEAAPGVDHGPGTVSVAMEQRRPAQFMRRTGVDLEGEERKLRVLPKYACSTCALGPECPEFKEGYVCAYEGAFKAFPVRDVDAVTALMVEIVDTNKARLRMAQLQERLTSGGMATPDVTRLSEVVLNQAKALVEMQQEVNKVTVTVAGGRDAPATGGGILSRLFSGGGSAGEQVRQVVEAKRPVLEMNVPHAEDPGEPISRGADDRDDVVAEDDPGEGDPGG